MFYRRAEKTSQLWTDTVTAMLQHLAGDHSSCSLVIGCDPDETPICHQLLSPSLKTFEKKGAQLFQELTDELRLYLLGNSKRNRRDMPVVMCALGSTSTIEASHARINNRELHRKGTNLDFIAHKL